MVVGEERTEEVYVGVNWRKLAEIAVNSRKLAYIYVALTYVPVYLELGNGGVGVILGDAAGPWQPPPIFFDREIHFCVIHRRRKHLGG